MRIRKYINVDILVEKIYDKACELHQFDRLTQDEIATKLHKARTTVLTQIRQAEARIKKWCAKHINTYEMLKEKQNYIPIEKW